MNRRAFTLIEVLLVIAIIAVLGVTAFSTVNSSTQRAFEFLSTVDDINNLVREARSNAVNQKIELTDCGENQIAHLSESHSIRIQYPQDNTSGGEFTVYKNGCILAHKTIKLDSRYKIEAYGQTLNENDKLTPPVDISYNFQSGDFSAHSNELKLNKRENKFITIKITDTKDRQTKYITIFQISGLPETMDENSFENSNWKNN